MTEIRSFAPTSKILLIFKNCGKKQLVDFPELLPVGLVRAHIHTNPDQSCKKNTPPTQDLDIAHSDDEEKELMPPGELKPGQPGAEITLE